MQQRFTERARRTIFFSQEAAGSLGDNDVSPEHILLGLMREEDSMAGQVLKNLHISRNLIRSTIEQQCRRDNAVLGQEMQFSSRAKQVIEFARESVKILNNDRIGTEHLLLGILCEEGLASSLLQAQGANVDKVTREVVRVQGSPSTTSDAATPPIPSAKPVSPQKERHPSMKDSWQHFSEYMRRALFFAQEEAKKREENQVTPEHLLLGLLHDSDNAAQHILLTVGRLSALSDQIRHVIDHTTKPGLRLSGKEMQLTTRSRKVLESASEHAADLDHDYIGTAHLLLAILEENGPACYILAQFGIDQDHVRYKLSHSPDEEKLGSNLPTAQSAS